MTFYDIRPPDHEGGYYTIERIEVETRRLPGSRLLHVHGDRFEFGAAHTLEAARALLPPGVQRIETEHGCAESWA